MRIFNVTVIAFLLSLFLNSCMLISPFMHGDGGHGPMGGMMHGGHAEDGNHDKHSDDKK